MSRRLRLLNAVLRRVVKPRLAATSSIAEARRDLDRMAARFLRRPPYLLHQRSAGEPVLHWVSSGPVSQARVILYFHGGAYIAGRPENFLSIMGRLSRVTGLPIAAPAYRLAPEHPAPAAFDDACRAHERLLELGYASDRIILGGDSAGGGLALALLARLCAQGQRPAAVFAFSPWVDLGLSGASIVENAARDPFLPSARLRRASELALGDLPADDPRVSPLFARYDAPPPVQLHVGTTEMLRDDSRRMAAHLRDAGGMVELNEWEDVPHIWPIFDGYIPEARECIGSVARFIEQH
ncbi:alpha/beta hydrolase fold domain-containing protein [Tropicimonas sediminicola]|uniref:Acetyl esterase/lipase n=1 Tax=Tropicimonas sediminicola TaxID=1031541 RepID=A0A239KLV6_9RHOB|nr:alpha/beta hydrolase fold domain-containing protein [Tropicimonas sediminicola]SNT18712.1 Acetyl esterase/lipase [Tropicimonas sediminicola]